MKLVGRDYISMNSLGDVQALTQLIKQIAGQLEPMLKSDAITGYGVMLLHDSERIEYEMLDEAEVRLITGGILPAVYVVIGFYSDKVDTVKDELASLESEFDLRMFSAHAH